MVHDGEGSLHHDGNKDNDMGGGHVALQRVEKYSFNKGDIYKSKIAGAELGQAQFSFKLSTQ